jgi:fibronectin-binding autotransporter adhesin
MKPSHFLRSFLLFAGSPLLSFSSLHAATFYWDQNGATTGFGTGTGTWAEDNTSPGPGRWTTSSDGTLAGSLTQATANTDIFNFGSTTHGLSTGSITVSGAVAMGNTTFSSLSGAITLTGGTINYAAASTITVNNTTNTINSTIGGAATSLTKAGTGTLVLGGNNTYAGQTIVNAGTLAVTGAATGTGAITLNGGTFNLGNGTATGSVSATVLNLAGGTFSYTRTGTNTEAFTTTNITAGPGAITTSLATQTLTLGSLLQTAGGTVNFSGSGVITTTTANTDGILGGWATFGGTTWAVGNGGASAITGLASYTLSSVAGTTGANYASGNIDVDNSPGTLDAGITASSLRFSAAGANTLDLTGANVLSSGGILVGSSVGGNLSTVSGGTLTGGANKDLTVIQNNTSGGLTISSNIINNTSSSIAKSGAGLLTLSGNNTFTGGVIINAGNLAIGNAGALNGTAGSENAVTFSAGSSGTLSLNGNSVVVRSLNTNVSNIGTAIVQNANSTAATLTVGNSANASSTFAGVIQDGTGGGALTLAKAGTGTLTLSGANTHTGGTVVNGGTLNALADANLGAAGGSVTVGADSTFVLLNGGTYANRQLAINNGAVLSFGNFNATWTGNVTGNGSVATSTGFGSQQTLSGTGNTFEGQVRIAGSGTGGQAYRFALASLADSSTANGRIVFSASSVTHANGSVFEYTGSTNLALNNRQIEIASTGSTPTNGHQVRNTGTGTLTVNTNLIVTSTTAQTLTLDGTNTGANAFSTNITNGSSSELSVRKTGSGSWALNGTANAFSGPIVFGGTTTSSGTLSYASAAGTNPVTFNATTAFGSTLSYTGASAITMSGLISATALTTGGINLEANGSSPTATVNYSNSASLSTASTGTSTRFIGFAGANTGDNTFAGAINNNTGVGGNTQVSKSGVGKWVLTGAGNYSGGFFLNNGTVSVASIPDGGVSSPLGANTRINLGRDNNDGVLVYTGPGNNTNRDTRIGGPSAASGTGGSSIINDGSGALTFTTTTFNISQTGITFNRTLILGGSYTGSSNAIQGVIQDNTASTGLVNVDKTGPGTWTLSGNNTYTGTTTVSGGTLLINGNSSTATGNVSVNSGTLGGTGSSGGGVTVSAGATLSPGASIESLAVASLSMGAGSIFDYEVANNSSTGADLLAVGGTVSLSSVTLSLDAATTAALGGGGWSVGNKLTLISYLGADITSGFSGYTDDTSYFFGANEWYFNYNDSTAPGGNYSSDATAGGQNRFVTMTLVPEPGAAFLGSLGLLALLCRRR